MESQQEDIDKLLLDLSFRNWALRSSAQDYEKWENLFKDNDELARLALEAKQIVIQIELTELKLVQEDFQSFARLEKKWGNSNSSVPNLKHSKVKSFKLSFNRIAKIAAVLSFIVISSGLWYFYADINIDQPIQEVAEIVNKQTQSGHQISIMLPDGSKVNLNSNSSISYPSNFNNNRVVTFEGEAFFSVVRDQSNPFVVNTENFTTEVLGTSFNLRAYKHSIAKVSVAEGKVKVSSFQDNNEQYYKILEKGNAASIDNKHIIDANFDMDEMLWKDGILVFSNENIQGISMKIQQWFNVSVKVTNNDFISGDFSGKYAKNESLEEILKGIGYALNFDFEIEGREIIINGKKY